MRLVLLALTVAIAALALLPGVGEARDEKTCRVKGSETVLASFRARVFKSAHGRYYACSYGARPLRVPGYSSLDSGVAFVRLSGDVAAYAQIIGDRYNPGDPSPVTVYRVDLRTRSISSVQYHDVGGLGGLVLHGTTVAFMLARQHFLADNVSRVVVWPRASSPRVVAAGDELDEGSLALGGSTLYWLRAGTPQTLRLHREQ